MTTTTTFRELSAGQRFIPARDEATVYEKCGEGGIALLFRQDGAWHPYSANQSGCFVTFTPDETVRPGKIEIVS